MILPGCAALACCWQDDISAAAAKLRFQLPFDTKRQQWLDEVCALRQIGCTFCALSGNGTLPFCLHSIAILNRQWREQHFGFTQLHDCIAIIALSCRILIFFTANRLHFCSVALTFCLLMSPATVAYFNSSYWRSPLQIIKLEKIKKSVYIILNIKKLINNFLTRITCSIRILSWANHPNTLDGHTRIYKLGTTSG